MEEGRSKEREERGKRKGDGIREVKGRGRKETRRIEEEEG